VALRLFTADADQGDAQAQVLLATFYRDGNIVEKNSKKGILHI